MLKRIFSIFAISLIITGLFFEGYSLKCPVYADTTTDEWTQVTTNAQLVEAFRYYCKSRDMTIEGSIADAVTTFSTKAFNGLCNTLGIDETALQAQIKYQTDGNTGTRFLFSALGIDAYNRIFAQFLQDNDLSVGDQDVNKRVYEGLYFTDSDGYKSLVYVTKENVLFNNWISTDKADIFSQFGSTYRGYTDSYLTSLYVNENYTYQNYINNLPWTITTQSNSNTYNYMDAHGTLTSNGNWAFTTTLNARRRNETYTRISELVILYYTNDSKLYLGSISQNLESGSNNSKYRFQLIVDLTDISNNENTVPCNINIVSNTINNNNYEGDTIINNNGTTGDDTPVTPPDPDDPTPDPPTLPDDGGWQDFQLPDMPNDWLIYGMEKKFPFDIPFNIMFGLSLLNHEPEIPKFEGDIDLKVCTWHYDIDLTPFDGIAQILRKFEVLAFIIGLAILTKELIMWG